MVKKILLVGLEGPDRTDVLGAFDSMEAIQLFTAGYTKYRPNVKFSIVSTNYYENLPTKGTP